MSPDGAQPMDDGPAGHPGEQAGGPGYPGEPTEEELRAAYEAELSRLSTTDVMAQAVVSLLNIGARRLAPPGASQAPGVQQAGAAQAGGGNPDSTHAERDLDQARDAIDAVRALLEILERRLPRELPPLRDALSRLQMAYAREVGPGAAASTAGPAGALAPSATPSPSQGTGGGSAEGASSGAVPPAGERASGPGPAESSGRLWVPGR
jgi:hypothetical protein